jgi:hypothetical protein
MSENTGSISIGRLILMPAVITLAITILRLVGELQHWSKLLFNPAAGGGAAIIGITWLPIIFGPYFVAKLAAAGEGPSGAGKVIGYAVLGLIIVFGGTFLAFAPKPVFPGKQLLGILLMAAGALLQLVPWGALAKALLAYGYAARLPVAIVMYFAIRGNWGTHYDVLPPGYVGPLEFWGKYLQIALIPQLIFWIAYTMLVGALFGGLWLLIARKKPAAQAA